MLKRQIILFIAFFSLAFLFQISVALATGPNAIPDTFNVRERLTMPGQSNLVPSGAQGGDQAGQQPTGVSLVIVRAIDLLVKFIASIALVVFIVGALLTVTSGGKEDRLEKGKNAMVYAVIGLLVAFFSFIVVTFVQSILF